MATKISALRGRVMKRLVDEVTTAFAKHHYEIITGQLKGSLYSTVRLILRQVLKQPKIWHVKNLRTPTKVWFRNYCSPKFANYS